MIEFIKALRDVSLYEPCGPYPFMINFLERSMTSALRSKSVRVAAKLAFVIGFQNEATNTIARVSALLLPASMPSACDHATHAA